MQFQVCLTFTVLSLFLAATGASGSESETATIATGLDYDDDLSRSDRRTFGDEHFEVIEDLKRKPCRSNVKVKNGRRRIENGGLEMKFRCNPGFMILGATVSICQNGKWSEEPPVCVKSGCKRFIMPQGVLGRPLFNGAVFSFHCQNPQQIMRGSPMIVCNGEKWNATTPRCYDPPTTTTTTEPTSTTSTTSAATTKTVIEHTSEKNLQDSLPEATDEATTTQTEVVNQNSASTTTDSMDLFQNPNWPSMNFTLQPIVEPEPNEVPEWPLHNTTTTTTTSTSKTPTSVPTSAATWTTTASHHAVIWLNQTRKPEATTTSTTSPPAILTTTTQKVSQTNITTPATSTTIKSLNSETTATSSTTSTTAPQTVNSTTRAPETSTTSATPLTTTSTTTTPSPPLIYTSKSKPLTPKPSDKQPESTITKWTTTPRSFVTYCSKFKGKKLEECLRQVNVTGRPGIPRRRPVRPTRKYPSRVGGTTRRPLSTRKPAWKPDYGSVANQSAPAIPLGLDSDEEPEDIKPLTTSTSTTTMTSSTTSSTSTTTTSKIELISAVDWHKLEQDNIPVKGTQLTEDSENGRIRRPKARDATDLGTAVMILVAIVVMVIAAGFAGRKYWRKHWGIARRSRSDSDCGSFNLGFSRECEDEFVFKEFGSGTATTTRDM